VKQTPALLDVLDALAERARSERAGARAGAVRELLELIRSSDGEAELPRLGLPAVERHRATFAPAVLEFVAAQERREIGRIRPVSLGTGETLASRLGANRWGAYRGMSRALGLVEVKAGARVAMVGCGPLPDTLFCLWDRTPAAELVGFDRDREAVATASALVAMLALDRISCVVADAAALDYSGFDLVCCSVFAEPRAAVLERIAATADPGASVLVREPVGAAVLAFAPVLEPPPRGLEVRARIEPYGGPFNLAYVALAATESRNERSM
jgi:hypothetical protein